MLTPFEAAMAALEPGALTEAAVARHVRPLFSRTLAGGTIYLANHTLGRPLDQLQTDLAEGADAWTAGLRNAWAPWLAEEQRHRAALAGLLGMARFDCVVPKVSAGSALRAVLNTLPEGALVLTTDAEFVSVTLVLAQYAAAGRLRVVRVPRTSGALMEALSQEKNTRLVVVSHIFYADALVFDDLAALANACRNHGAKLLVDCYHSLGVLPFQMDEIGCDYLIGGCYKYLRGGPGVAFLAMSTQIADRGLRTLDAGWFAAEPAGDTWQAGGPELRSGGDAWLEGTPPVLTYYQARAGLALTAAIGIKRLRAYSLEQLRYLKDSLAAAGIAGEGADEQHGAFLTVPHADAPATVKALNAQGLVIDARDGRLRICPDVLTTRAELEHCAQALARANEA